MTKYCVDCKWCSHREPTLWDKIFVRYVPAAEFSKCLHQESIERETRYKKSKTYVDGKDRTEYNYCSIMRYGYAGAELCGPDAKLFEPKD